MSLRGVGIDVSDVHRITRLVDSYGARFTRRWFTSAEIAQCEAKEYPARAFTGCFAAKEAIWKAIRLEWTGPVPWRSIAVLDTPLGLSAHLDGRVAGEAYSCGVTRISVVITVCINYAIALAIAEESDDA